MAKLSLKTFKLFYF